MIASTWPVVRLKHVATAPTRRAPESVRPFVTLEDVDNGTGRLVHEVEERQVGDGALLEPGDIGFSKLRPYLRKSLLVDRPIGATGELVALRPSSQLDQRFLLYVTLSESWVSWANTTAQGTKMPRTSPEFLLDFALALPPLDEQRRIADFLDAETSRIDRFINAQHRCVRLLGERRAAAVHSLVAGSSVPTRRPSGLAWTETLPSAWETVNLSLLARMGSGHTPSRSRPEWWIDTEIPWITTGEVSQVRDDRQEVITKTRERISRIGLANSAAEIHPAGTVVLSRTASAGFSAVMGLDMATSQDFVTWTCGPRIDPFYLLWCLRAMRPDLLGRLAIGSTHKTIYVPDLQGLRVPVPPIDAQRTIVDEIRASNAVHDRLSDAIERQLVLLAERRQALITAALTGQVGVSSTSRRQVICGSG